MSGHEIVRVTRHQPCPVCRKQSWCGIGDGFAICMRTASEKPTQNGGWLHTQGESVPAVQYLQDFQRLAKQNAWPRGSDTFLDRAYRSFVGSIPLHERHQNNLKARGLSEAEIERNMYRSAPNGNAIAMNYDMAIVPGFAARANKEWRCTAPGGILIPVRDGKRRIIGFQVRLDNPLDGSKYVWLSSAAIGGPSPGARAHLALPPDFSMRAGNKSPLWITEGVLKADIAAARLQAPVIGVPGVNCWKKALPLVTAAGAPAVIIAYDNDYAKNEHVRFHARALANALLTARCRVYAALWEDHKGLDDALVAKADIRLVRVTSVSS